MVSFNVLATKQIEKRITQIVSANTLCKNVLNVKNTVIDNFNLYSDEDGVKHIRIKARPNKWHENDCPFCHKSCPVYDKHSSRPTTWRGLDWGGIMVEVEYQTHRIICLEHGVYAAEVPWAYPGSRFTKDFDLTVAWFASYLPRSTTSYFMRVEWETVGRCVNRALHDLEPERSRRLDGLVHIGIDETSYKKGHKYITVIVNHDTNTVVWASEGHGKSVLEKFYSEYKQVKKDNPRSKGRPKKDDPELAIVKAAKVKADEIKGSAYALGKAPEHLTEKQQLRVSLIASHPPGCIGPICLKSSSNYY